MLNTQKNVQYSQKMFNTNKKCSILTKNVQYSQKCSILTKNVQYSQRLWTNNGTCSCSFPGAISAKERLDETNLSHRIKMGTLFVSIGRTLQIRSHFDIKSWVTSTRDSEQLENIWVKLTLNCESIWLEYSPITRNSGSNCSSTSYSTF